MVKFTDNTLDLTFSALADPTRRAILARLALGGASVGELAAPFAVSAPAISKHLKVLERARLLSRKKDGRVHRCRLEPAPMDEAGAWIEFHRRFWGDRLDELERYLEQRKRAEDNHGTDPTKGREG